MTQRELFSKNMAAARKKRGVTQDEAAVILNVKRPRLAKWEEGLATPDPMTLAKIIRVYKIALEDITTFLGEGEYNPNKKETA